MGLATRGELPISGRKVGYQRLTHATPTTLLPKPHNGTLVLPRGPGAVSRALSVSNMLI
jgi:hypothetical protein